MTKIEEVARAIYRAEWGEELSGDCFTHEHQEKFAMARAAIEAMKNPTPQMRDAFLRNAETGATPSDEDSVEFTLSFNAAIDAALKETP